MSHCRSESLNMRFSSLDKAWNAIHIQFYRNGILTRELNFRTFGSWFYKIMLLVYGSKYILKFLFVYIKLLMYVPLIVFGNKKTKCICFSFIKIALIVSYFGCFMWDKRGQFLLNGKHLSILHFFFLEKIKQATNY